MILDIPLSSDPAQNFTTQLGDKKYVFDVQLNDRAQVWTFTLSDSITGEIILAGIPIVLGVDLLSPYNLNLGALIAIDLTAQGKDAGPDDLGTNVVLTWFSADEL